jgi:hypothetical protein
MITNGQSEKTFFLTKIGLGKAFFLGLQPLLFWINLLITYSVLLKKHFVKTVFFFFALQS